jgi:hypothetical protein
VTGSSDFGTSKKDNFFYFDKIEVPHWQFSAHADTDRRRRRPPPPSRNRAVAARASVPGTMDGRTDNLAEVRATMPQNKLVSCPSVRREFHRPRTEGACKNKSEYCKNCTAELT